MFASSWLAAFQTNLIVMICRLASRGGCLGQKPLQVLIEGEQNAQTFGTSNGLARSQRLDPAEKYLLL